MVQREENPPNWSSLTLWLVLPAAKIKPSSLIINEQEPVSLAWAPQEAPRGGCASGSGHVCAHPPVPAWSGVHTHESQRLTQQSAASVTGMKGCSVCL